MPNKNQRLKEKKMWKAIKKFVQEYKELPDEGKQLLAKESLSYLCYYYITWQKEKQMDRDDSEKKAKLREIAGREFVPFSYWKICFTLPNQIGLTVQATDFYPGQIDFASAKNAGGIYVSEDATFLYATQIYVDSVEDLPEWCPTARCEYGTYLTSPAWVKERANAND